MTFRKNWLLAAGAITGLLFSGCVDPYASYSGGYSYFVFEGEQAFCNDVDFDFSEIENKNFTCVDPVYQSLEEFRGSTIEVVEPKDIEQAGKVYGFSDYLFTVDHEFGVAIWQLDLDQTRQLGFIKIPGVSDISISGNDGSDGAEIYAYLYANNYADLVQIDLLDIENPDPSIVRISNVFDVEIENLIPKVPQSTYFNFSKIDIDAGYIIGYRVGESSDIVYFGE